ncbi:MAG TPA: NADP-dependent oxidoreductase [Sphingobacteriaceae bacterium]
MKSIRINSYGPAENLEVVEAPVPGFNQNEILVKVHAAAVNHIDELKASGQIKHIYPLTFPWTPGCDFSGIIQATGSAVHGFAPGDEVYGSNTNGGAYAEYIVVTPEMIAKKPTTLSFIEAASVPMAAETANQALFNYAHLTSGQKILIHGAAGAVGSYAVQLAHQAGGYVIGTASSAHHEYLKLLGADEVIDYTTPFEKVVQNTDIVFDLVGGEVQEKSFGIIKEGGILIAVNQPPSLEAAKEHGITAVFMHAKPTNSGLTKIAFLIDEGKLKTNIAHVYGLEDIVQAWINISSNLANNKLPADFINANYRKRHGKHVIQI